jgi:hypothetical protein
MSLSNDIEVRSASLNSRKREFGHSQRIFVLFTIEGLVAYGLRRAPAGPVLVDSTADIVMSMTMAALVCLAFSSTELAMLLTIMVMAGISGVLGSAVGVSLYSMAFVGMAVICRAPT